MREARRHASVLARRAVQYRRPLLLGRWNWGTCTLCGGRTVFVESGPSLRDGYRCVRCGSVPRRRALTLELERRAPGWRHARVHEFGPSPASVGWFGDRCAAYTYSHHWPDVALGTTRDGVRCEDLTRLTFDDASFDVVVTQDVFEHLPDPAAAAAEIARVLAPGGVHVATVPIYGQPTTQVRAILEPDGTTTHVVPPEYHGNPVDDTGSLVFRRWGDDVVEFVERATGLPTERVVTEDRRLGLAGTMLDVLVSTKPHATRRAPATDAAR